MPPTRPRSKRCAPPSTSLPIDGTVVIGEGERDEAPMLFIGEKVGQGGLAVDIALDPLEGTTLTAKAMANALAVMAMAEPGTMLNAPDTYMDKIAIGPGYQGRADRSGCRARRQHQCPGQGQGRARRTRSPRCIMDRPRHEALIAKVRKAGAAVQLITDGDVAGVIDTTDPATGIDIYIGTGGAPEGVLAAAALRCVGGQMQGRLVFRNDDERARAAKWGIKDLNRKYALHGSGVGRCGVLRHRRHRRLDAARRASRGQFHHHRKRGDALGHRHGALDQGAPPPRHCLRRYECRGGLRRRALLFGPALAAEAGDEALDRAAAARTELSPVLARLLAARGVSAGRGAPTIWHPT